MRYDPQGDWASVNDDRATYNALKIYSNIGTGVTFYQGIGMLPGIGDGAPGSVEFTYLCLGEEEYGESVVLLDVEDGEINETPHVALSFIVAR